MTASRERQRHTEEAKAARISRREAKVREATDLVGRMKADGMVAERKDGTLLLRSYGRAALIALATIAAQDPREEES